ncbi:uncharacterized protein SCHCODRAFT_01034572 [Schizophyllum commune H4-8]|uniref:MYND-type domain-containing protein n=1 Tax=Schizophyllum commune (strain H4-8 / FGSC 9210) TaxID=578458 RepID=D8QEN2_SCHCM|nr:uncharacterized protein SCHCODRAFT_01034572 [Schizophyllum commune H4-8]KAI5888213.1 hypothetical protein SCHCODRAFT_01034572 [Schizophyllum commune H4-8]
MSEPRTFKPEPITLILPVPGKCEVCEAQAEELLLRCSTCKDRFYCSPACQKGVWKDEHKLCCSLLPVPLSPASILPSAALSAEVRRAGTALTDILEEWQQIDETVEPELKNPTRRVMHLHNLPAEFFWSDTWEYRLMKDGTPLPELTLYAFRRLFWLDTVSRIQTASQYDELLSILRTTERSKHLMRVIPEKALARPDELSPGGFVTRRDRLRVSRVTGRVVAATRPVWFRHHSSACRFEMPTAYEKQKAANIERNKALLASLGVEDATTLVFKDKPKPAPKPKPKKAAPKKRKEPPAREENEEPDTMGRSRTPFVLDVGLVGAALITGGAISPGNQSPTVYLSDLRNPLFLTKIYLLFIFTGVADLLFDNTNIYDVAYSPRVIVSAILNICLNMYCTSEDADQSGRLPLKLMSVPSPYLVEDLESGTQSFVIFIESAGFYLSVPQSFLSVDAARLTPLRLFSVAVVVVYLAGSPVIFLLVDLATVIAGLAYMFINVRVALGVAHEGIPTEPSGLNFATGPLTQQSTVLDLELRDTATGTLFCFMNHRQYEARRGHSHKRERTF